MKRISSISEIGAFVLTFSFGLFLQGAIPFFSISTLGQSVVVAGYPISFINAPEFSLYASNIGYPAPAAMSTLLAPALAMQLFLWIGFQPQDAFNFAFLAWYSLGYFGAFKIARINGVATTTSALLSLVWMSIPIVWMSSGYSHLHFGLVLLPYLFYVCVFNITATENRRIGATVLYPISAFLAVFTDGYVFVFFAIGASLLLASQALVVKELRAYFFKRLLPLHLLSFSSAYLAYALYIGKSEYGAASLDFFRGWGVDLIFLILPTQGVHWFWDVFGFSVSRSSVKYFGDASVWVSTFSLPLVIFGLYCYLRSKNKFLFSGGMLSLVIFGAYMAMGPSIKFNSVKSFEMGPTMPAQYAVAATGNSLLSEHVPGFRSMRASYRWIALSCFGLWGLIVGCLSNSCQKRPVAGPIGLLTLVVLFVPNLQSHSDLVSGNYNQFLKLDRELASDLKDYLAEYELVAFLPWGNDFLANYLAPRLNVRTYNVGGDKNVDSAKMHWPDSLKGLSASALNNQYAAKTLYFMSETNVDAIVFPWVDMLWGAHRWPTPSKYTDEISSILQDLYSSGYVSIVTREYYSIVRLKPEFASQHGRREIKEILAANYCLSANCLRVTGFNQQTPSQAGVVRDGKLVSVGKHGFLHFGPYSPLNAGKYVLRVFGSSQRPSGAWVDVVSGKGSSVHGKVLIATTGRPNKHSLLATASIEIAEDVKDVEVRLYVEQEADVELWGYELTPVVGENKQ